MISRLARVKNFGVFNDFTWTGDLPPFKKANAIYGWNYSGKTTISRVFRCIELGQLHEDYSDALFQLSTLAGEAITASHLEIGLPVRVFNSDFVRDNLVWETGFNPIFILGSDVIELRKQLVEKQAQYDAVARSRSELKQTQASINANLEARMTDVARSIGIMTNNSRTYRRPNLQATVSKIGEAFSNFILPDDEYEQLCQRFASTDRRDNIEPLAFGPPDFPKLREETATHLSHTVQANTLDRLKNNVEVSEWVRRGLELHLGREVCHFCENKLPADLMSQLAGHFSDQYEELQTRLEQLEQKLIASKTLPALPPKEGFYPDLQRDYSKLAEALLNHHNSVREGIDALLQGVNAKKVNAFSVLGCPDLQDGTSQVVDSIAAFNELVRTQNERNRQFENEKSALAEKIELHVASVFIKQADYLAKQRELESLSSAITLADLAEKKLREERDSLEAKISEVVKGADRINEYLRAFFSKDDLAIRVFSGRYKVMRGEIPAKNLSEGERTAIALAYFVARVEDKGTTLDQTLIVIDDPISSLDANHIYNTYAFIRQKLSSAAQIIISTHNFEFFNLVKSWYEADFKKQWSAYLVERLSASESTIRELPPELLKFRSEYHYLFSILHRAANAESTDFGYLFQLPNVVRRFLEAFTGFTVPVSAGLEVKLENIMPDDRERHLVYKFINHYSHNGSLERSLHYPDLQECRQVIQIALNAAKARDSIHYEHMVKVIETQ